MNARCWAVVFWVGLLMGPDTPASAQVAPQPGDSLLSATRFATVTRQLTDSLTSMVAARTRSDWAAVRRISTFALSRYPRRVGRRPTNPATSVGWFSYYEGNSSTAYPYGVYKMRLEANRVLNFQQGQVTDLSALIHFDSLEHRESWELIQRYVQRGQLRLSYLHDPAGCADLQEAYRRDAGQREMLLRWGCTVPPLRYAIGQEAEQQAAAALRDSLAIVERWLGQQRYAAAWRSLGRLRAGQAGPFTGANTRTGALYSLRARTRQALGDYAGARADHDSAVATNRHITQADLPELYYQRGLFRLSAGDDRDQGCADLQRAYELDPGPANPQDPRWRGCPVRYKLPLTKEQKLAAIQLYTDSLVAASSSYRAGRYAQARRTCDQLLAGYAGIYRVESIDRLLEEFYRNHQSRRGIALDTRALSWQGEGNYAAALADFTYAIAANNYASYCNRGLLKIDHLNDPDGGCADLNRCRDAGIRLVSAPPGLDRWRGCTIEANTFGSLRRRYLTAPVATLFAGADVLTPRIGLFAQGAFGLELGALLSPGEWLAAYGPSLGFDLVFNPLLVAPKLSYEGELGIVGGRLDVAYYTGSYQGSPRGDLRITPQLGLSGGALLNLFYGYSVPVAGKEVPELGRHRISLYINFLKISKIGG